MAESRDRLDFKLRPATAADAPEVCELLIRSVREVCARDYNHDAEILDFWCSNKTPERVTQWITNPDNYFVVAVDTRVEAIVGAGMITRAGVVHICYLLPHAVGRGVGKALMNDMLRFASEQGLKKVDLSSTITAKAFYEHLGFRVTEERLALRPPQGVPQYVMVLSLT